MPADFLLAASVMSRVHIASLVIVAVVVSLALGQGGKKKKGPTANYLYLDGHVVTLPWDAAVLDMYPEKGVLVKDATYQQ